MSFYQGLNQVDEKVIEQIKESILAKLSQKPENVYVETQTYTQDWLEQNYKFDSKAISDDLIKGVKKATVLKVYREMLIDGKSEQIMV